MIRLKVALPLLLLGIGLVPGSTDSRAASVMRLEKDVSYRVPDAQIWVIDDPEVFNGPTTDLSFNDARVYFSKTGTLEDTKFLLVGRFDITIEQRIGMSLFIQSGSVVKVGSRPALVARVIDVKNEDQGK